MAETMTVEAQPFTAQKALVYAVATPVAAAIVAPFLVLRAWVLTQVWAWWLVEVAPLSMAHAMAVVLLAAGLRGPAVKDGCGLAERMAQNLCNSLALLFIAWALRWVL